VLEELEFVEKIGSFQSSRDRRQSRQKCSPCGISSKELGCDEREEEENHEKSFQPGGLRRRSFGGELASYVISR
jgi:hypothetical protein